METMEARKAVEGVDSLRRRGEPGEKVRTGASLRALDVTHKEGDKPLLKSAVEVRPEPRGGRITLEDQGV